MIVQALVIFLIMLLPVWFVFSLIKVIQYQNAISAATEVQERAVAVKYRTVALISLLFTAALIALIVYAFTEMASIQC